MKRLLALHTVILFAALSVSLSGLPAAAEVVEPVPLGPIAADATAYYEEPAITVLNGYYYSKMDGFGEGDTLWRTDGTPDGSEAVHVVEGGFIRGLVAGSTQVYFSVFYYESQDETVYAIGNEDSHAREIVRDVHSLPHAMAAVGDRCFWYGRFNYVGKLWVTEGTPESTKLLKTFDYDTSFDFHFPGSQIYPIGPVENGVVFSAPAGDSGVELWFSDGTTAGTYLIANLCGPGESLPVFSSVPHNFRRVGNLTYFEIIDAAGFCPENSAYRTDGTPEGTEPAAFPGAIVGDTIYKVTDNGVFISLDGGPGGETCAPPGHDLTLFDPFIEVAVGPQVFLVLFSYEIGYELWHTDGTCDDLELIADLNPGLDWGVRLSVDPSRPQYAQRHGYIFFYGNDGEHGWEIWRASGNPVSLERLTDLAPGAEGISFPETHWPPHMVVLDNRLLFWAAVGDDDLRLWALEIPPPPDEGCPNCPPDEVLTVNYGDFAVIEAPETVAPEGPYQWYHDGKPITGTRFQGADTRTLAIPYVQLTHAGLYACEHGPAGAYYVIELEVSGEVPAAGMAGLAALVLALSACACMVVQRFICIGNTPPPS
ncbi:MAG: hypothetical protein ACLFTT_16255 [Candidatus Hydrogenedentota bacterium]